MRFPSVSALTGLAISTIGGHAAPATHKEIRASPTVYFCGDSTMARNTNGVLDGWGNYIANYLTVPVVNRAISGRSSRSFWNEGRFQSVANELKAGDIVVIEFGHNDVGSPRSNDNGRSVCPGTGSETCISDKTGEVVHTFVHYIVEASKLMLNKGATVILSSQTPRNQWAGGSYNGVAPRFVEYQQIAARTVGDSRATFVDHFQAVSRMYLKLGSNTVNSFYPVDPLHPSPRGSDLIAQAFAQAIAQKLNGQTSLAPYVKSPVPIVY